MKHMVTINRRLDLSGAPWHIIVNGLAISLCDKVPTQKQVDDDIARFDQMMSTDDDALTSLTSIAKPSA